LAGDLKLIIEKGRGARYEVPDDLKVAENPVPQKSSARRQGTEGENIKRGGKGKGKNGGKENLE